MDLIAFDKLQLITLLLDILDDIEIICCHETAPRFLKHWKRKRCLWVTTNDICLSSSSGRYFRLFMFCYVSEHKRSYSYVNKVCDGFFQRFAVISICRNEKTFKIEFFFQFLLFTIIFKSNFYQNYETQHFILQNFRIFQNNILRQLYILTKKAILKIRNAFHQQIA